MRHQISSAEFRKKARHLRKNYRMGAISNEKRICQTMTFLYLAGKAITLSPKRLRELGLTEQPTFQPPIPSA